MPQASNLLDCDRVAHRFFTRDGGVSSGVYASLNCGSGSDDDPEDVTKNQRRAVQMLAGKDMPLCRCWQIHSADVAVVDEPWAADAPPKADAMVTNKPDIVLGILTADCAPVLFADERGGVIGAAHAGWKGAVGGVLGNTIAAMEALGAEKKCITAAVGPCIAQASYQVGEEFYQQFVEANTLYGTFFKTSDEDAYYQFDLAGFVKHLLMQSGLQNVSALDMDTYSDEAQFFSYRRKTHRNEADYGRQLSAIMLKP